MKKLTREQLQQDATRLMQAHKKNKVYATQDGNFFLTSSDAILHNNGLKEGKEWDGEIINFCNDSVSAPAPENTAPAPVMHTIAKDEDIIKHQAENKNKEQKEARTDLKNAETALKLASTAYVKAERAVAKKPEDENLKKIEADAKSAYEQAKLTLENAKTKLEALQAK